MQGVLDSRASKQRNRKTKVGVTRSTGLGSLSRLPRKIQYNILSSVHKFQIHKVL